MKRIKLLRKQRNWSQQKLADMMNVSRSTVAMWESGTQPSNETLIKLASLFEVSLDYLLNVEGASYDTTNDSDLWELREQLRRRPGMRTLFSAAKDATEADLIKAVKIIEALKGDTDAD